MHAPSSSTPTPAPTEGYPSWLPRRPSGPAPASTLHSTARAAPPADDESGSSPEPRPPFVGGRLPTPRSVRVVRVQPLADDGTLGRRIPTDTTRVAGASRAWSRATASPPALAALAAAAAEHTPRPRFRARHFRPEMVQHTGMLSRVHYRLLPLLVFAHIPAQSFLDFNAVYILLQLARFPNPGSSGRAWALGAAAYIGCWALWLLGVVLLYEVVYSFARRWRVKRPLMTPLYLSAPGSALVRMTSYTHFCFVEHVRAAAWTASPADALAEFCSRRAQNAPTVATLLPRAALALTVLLSCWVAPALAPVNSRDGTFFDASGALSLYARGVLAANVAWAVVRALLLLAAWVGLWVASGEGAAGLCGPRYRWEEEDAEKRASVLSVGARSDDGDADALPWAWRDRAAARVAEAFAFCSVPDPRSAWLAEKAQSPVPVGTGEYDVRVLAALNNASGAATRRPVLGELFKTPAEEVADPLAAIEEVPRTTPTEPYPFKGFGSQDRVPFPPSPGPELDGETDEHTDEDEDEDDEVDDVVEVESAARARSSGSMSSLGQPVPSRYPFQFRRPVARSSLGSPTSPRSAQTPGRRSGATATTSSGARSGISASTGNGESPESALSHAPPSSASGSAGARSLPPIATFMPAPPRARTRRPRAAPDALVLGRPLFRARTDTDSSSGSISPSPSALEHTFGAIALPGDDSDGEAADSVGLLSARASRANLRGSRANSLVSSGRSRAQSLIAGVAAASRSSVDVVAGAIAAVRARSDAARLSDSDPSSGEPSGGEHHTFGHPLRRAAPSGSDTEDEAPAPRLRGVRSALSAAPADEDDTFMPAHDGHDRDGTIRGAPVAIPRPALARHSTTDLASARQSFVTAPGTPGAASTLAWTPSTAGGGMHYVPHGGHPA